MVRTLHTFNFLTFFFVFPPFLAPIAVIPRPSFSPIQPNPTPAHHPSSASTAVIRHSVIRRSLARLHTTTTHERPLCPAIGPSPQTAPLPPPPNQPQATLPVDLLLLTASDGDIEKQAPKSISGVPCAFPRTAQPPSIASHMRGTPTLNVTMVEIEKNFLPDRVVS